MTELYPLALLACHSNGRSWRARDRARRAPGKQCGCFFSGAGNRWIRGLRAGNADAVGIGPVHSGVDSLRTPPDSLARAAHAGAALPAMSRRRGRGELAATSALATTPSVACLEGFPLFPLFPLPPRGCLQVLRRPDDRAPHVGDRAI